MKIRTKLTLFFTLISFVLFIFVFAYISYSTKKRMEKIITHRLNEFFQLFHKRNKLYEIETYDELKELDLRFPNPGDRIIDDIDDSKNNKDKFEKTEKNFGNFIWFALYDKDFNLLNASELAKQYPIELDDKKVEIKLFNYTIKNVEDNPALPSDKDNNVYNIGSLKEYKTKTDDIFYLVLLIPNTKEKEYMNEIRIMIIELIFAVAVLIFIAGLFFSKFSLNPIKKIQSQLNNITEDELSKRIKIKNTKDEIGELSLSINSLLERIENAFKMGKQFISDVSHEFNTPLSILRLNIENIISNEKLSNDETDRLASSLEILYSMKFLVEKLLHLSRLESNRCVLQSEDVNLNKTIKKINNNLSIVAENKNLKIDLKLSKEPFILNCDEKLIYIALYNFIENSIKYSNKGNITITTSFNEKQKEIKIQDNGIGIPKNQFDKIFNKFYQVDKSRGENLGYGIGLTIAKRIIDLHKGRIEIESVIGKGTIVNVIFL